MSEQSESALGDATTDAEREDADAAAETPVPADPAGAAVRLLPTAQAGTEDEQPDRSPDQGAGDRRRWWRRLRAVTQPDAAAISPQAAGQSLESETAEGSGFGELRLDLPGPFAPTWQESVRRALRLALLSRRAPAVRPALLPLVAAGWAAITGLLGAAVLLALSGVPFTASGIAVIWLAGNHVPIATEAGTISLLPLGLLLLPLLPLRRAGRFVAVHLDGAAGVVGGIAVACYAGIATALAIALSSAGGPVAAAWPTALLWAGVTAAAGGAWGLVRERRGRWRPPPLAIAVGMTVVVPLLLGTLLAAALALADVGAVLDGQQRLAAAPLEHVGLILLQLGYLPNLLVWAGAFVVGSGFAIGADNTLAPFTDGQPMLPDLPVLAIVPSDVPTWTALLPLIVAGTGTLAALIMARGSREQQLGRRIARIAPIAAASGACWALLALLSAGAIGDARLAAVGPSVATGLVAAVLVGAGGLVWAVLPTLAADARPRAADLRARMQPRPAAPEPSRVTRRS